MTKEPFDPNEFYSDYPDKVLLRPGYPARAQYKSTLLWDLFGKRLLSQLGHVSSYADVGGCFGFGANALAYQVFCSQGSYPVTKVFEISEGFVSKGKTLFPYIDFISKPFEEWEPEGHVFDLVSLFDVIEHLERPAELLKCLSHRSKYLLLATPMETKGFLRGNRAPQYSGSEHPDGHVQFFSPTSYKKLVQSAGFEFLGEKLVFSIIPRGAERILEPEHWEGGWMGKAKNYLHRWIRNPHLLPFGIPRLLFGYGKHLALVKSLAVK